MLNIVLINPNGGGGKSSINKVVSLPTKGGGLW